MKKILFALLTTTLFFSSCVKDPDPVLVELSKAVISESTLPQIAKEFTFDITNKTADGADIEWERIGDSEPAGFVYTINGSTDRQGKIRVESNEKVSIVLVIDPKGNTGVATGKIRFYDKRNAASTTQDFEYSLTIETALFSIEPIGSMNSSNIAAFEKNYYVNVINYTFSPVIVNWEQDTTNQNNTQGWTTAIALQDSIPNSQAIKKGVMYLEPLDTIKMEAKFKPNGNVGLGGVNLFFYVGEYDSLTRVNQLIRHTATI